MQFRLPSRKNEKHTPAPGTAGFNKSAGSSKGRVFGFLIGIPFFAISAFICWFGAVQPILLSIGSQSWPEVPCTIVTSEVERVRGNDGTTYRVAITFSYAFQGREYTGGNYDFSTGSSSGLDSKSQIVSNYPIGHQSTAWVNPDSPTVAVLSRSVPSVAYFILPFTSVFMVIGAGIMLGSAGFLPREWTAGMNKSRHERVPQSDRGDAQLKPASGPIGKLAGIAVFAAIWNGVTGAFVWIIIDSFREGDPEWFLVFFLIPFVLIGLGALGAVVYYALALANPKVKLSLSEGSPRLNETVRLTWQISGSVQRLNRIEITLEGREAATYRRGTRSVTDRSLFCRETVFETDHPREYLHSQVDFTLPDNLMHSFLGGNNKIEWCLKVRGFISRWPDVNDSYPITIRPLKITLD